MLIFGLALLNARSYSQAESRPTKSTDGKLRQRILSRIATLQASVFQKSFTGPYIKNYLGFLLIQPNRAASWKAIQAEEWQGRSHIARALTSRTFPPAGRTLIS